MAKHHPDLIMCRKQPGIGRYLLHFHKFFLLVFKAKISTLPCKTVEIYSISDLVAWVLQLLDACVKNVRLFLPQSKPHLDLFCSPACIFCLKDLRAFTSRGHNSFLCEGSRYKHVLIR